MTLLRSIQLLTVAIICFIAAPMRDASAGTSLLPGSADSSGFSPEGLNGVTSYLDAEITQGRLAGALMLVQKDGKPAYFESFGVRDPATHQPMTADSLFRLYSMTKPVTSVAAMMLVDDGKLSLDDPVAKYIPSFAGVKVGVDAVGPDGKPRLDLVQPHRAVTVLDLMRQSSGIISIFSEVGLVTRSYFAADLFAGDFDNAEFAERIARLPLAYQPGTVWDYGHSTDILGRIIEVASGMSLYDFEKQRLFDPMGLNDTRYFVTDPAMQARIAEPMPYDRVIGNELIRDPRIVRRWQSGGAGLVSSVGDYARFLQMLLNGGTLDGRRYLSRDAVAMMRKNEVGPGTGVKPWAYYFPGAGFGYGLGFGVRIAPGEDGVPGYLGEIAWGGAAGTYFWAYPEQNIIALFMVQTPTQRGRIQPELKTLVYDAIVK
jgi:CubicO group peptidase (beta-lactamase class C family)